MTLILKTSRDPQTSPMVSCIVRVRLSNDQVARKICNKCQVILNGVEVGFKRWIKLKVIYTGIMGDKVYQA